eukprot:scaffold31254_cov39-Tisochrysis_lutea.AAC.1
MATTEGCTPSSTTVREALPCSSVSYFAHMGHRNVALAREGQFNNIACLCIPVFSCGPSTSGKRSAIQSKSVVASSSRSSKSFPSPYLSLRARVASYIAAESSSRPWLTPSRTKPLGLHAMYTESVEITM